MLTVKEIETKSFSKAKVGYSPDEVDNFLDEILEDYDRFAEEIASLNKKIETLDQTISDLKKQNASTKFSVSQTPENLIENAQTKAEKLVNDAQDYAKKLIEAAKIESENQQQRTARLNKEVADFKSNLLSLYESHVKLISSIPEIKDFSVEDSGSLELLKSATTDITEDSAEQLPTEVPETQIPLESPDDSFGEIIPDIKFEEEEAISGEDFNVVMDVEEDVKLPSKEETAVKSRRKKMIEEKKPEVDEEDDEDYIDFEDFDDEDEKGSAFGSLFGGKKVKKEKKKKHHFFNVEDDDDDFDDDFDDDDDF